MTDAERLARAYVDARSGEHAFTYVTWDDMGPEGRGANIAAAQSLIDSGRVTVNPDPTPDPTPDAAPLTAKQVVSQIAAWDTHTHFGEGCEPCPTCLAQGWMRSVPEPDYAEAIPVDTPLPELRAAVLAEALAHIADGRQCTKVVASAPPSHWCRNRSDRHRTGTYTSTRWCDTCIARDALERATYGRTVEGEGDTYDHADMAARLSQWLSPGGSMVGTGAHTVEVDPATMSAILDAAETTLDRNEPADDDVTRLAEMLRVGGPGYSGMARHLLEQGVTLLDPPPDPVVGSAEPLRDVTVTSLTPGRFSLVVDGQEWNQRCNAVTVNMVASEPSSITVTFPVMGKLEANAESVETDRG